eukprot:TRINITY_DN14628_c0_g1_i1.p1 TRINITY_DN14628_c0_g1~~TRINITY_DN14628_c0_g1_i1.p1  ORF type:complete len:367 (+),score=59.10 TRINITY_DN14628_c0_g1_i1:91-1191(+)
MKITDLPDDLIAEIFGHLDANSVLLADITCKTFHQVAREDHIWKAQYINRSRELGLFRKNRSGVPLQAQEEANRLGWKGMFFRSRPHIDELVAKLEQPSFVSVMGSSQAAAFANDVYRGQVARYPCTWTLYLCVQQIVWSQFCFISLALFSGGILLASVLAEAMIPAYGAISQQAPMNQLPWWAVVVGLMLLMWLPMHLAQSWQDEMNQIVIPVKTHFTTRLRFERLRSLTGLHMVMHPERDVERRTTLWACITAIMVALAVEVVHRRAIAWPAYAITGLSTFILPEMLVLGLLRYSSLSRVVPMPVVPLLVSAIVLSAADEAFGEFVASALRGWQYVLAVLLSPAFGKGRVEYLLQATPRVNNAT